jgi:hypothetical protein
MGKNSAETPESVRSFLIAVLVPGLLKDRKTYCVLSGMNIINVVNRANQKSNVPVGNGVWKKMTYIEVG